MVVTVIAPNGCDTLKLGVQRGECPEDGNKENMSPSSTPMGTRRGEEKTPTTCEGVREGVPSVPRP